MRYSGPRAPRSRLSYLAEIASIHRLEKKKKTPLKRQLGMGYITSQLGLAIRNLPVLLIGKIEEDHLESACQIWDKLCWQHSRNTFSQCDVARLLITEAYHFSCIDNEVLMPITTDSLPNAYQMDEITLTADIAGLPPTISSSAAVADADFQSSNDEIMRITNAHNMLREQWGCDEPGHELCLQGNEYVGHVQLSKEQISIWIGKICQGQATCHYPPKMFIVPDGSGSNRNPNFDWGASGTTTDTEAEIEPGYFCGLALERIGGIILYHSKVSLLFAKLLVYEQMDHVSPEITSALYGSLTSAPLHNHYDEVLSTFVVILARCFTGSWERDHYPFPNTLTYLPLLLCLLRRISFEELNAIHDCLESWVQKRSLYDNRDAPYFIYFQMIVSTSCSQDDARFHILSEAVLDIALDTTIGTTLRHNRFDMFLDAKGLTVHRFFADRVLLIDDVKKISRIATFIAFYLRHVVYALFHGPIQPRLWYTVNSLAITIKTITSLIAASPNPEYYCRKIRAGNVINAFVKFFSHPDPLDFCYPFCDLEDSSPLETESHSLLLLIANPFTGRSVLSSSYCMSILEDNGWVGSAPSASG
ncbi:hypothetical protein BU17DRAFT_69096 [Hysterangium stoloniferum]|nr:hypothetical protein BU17DRAFT_69096 [Hysterangium stoloniferum]